MDISGPGITLLKGGKYAKDKSSSLFLPDLPEESSEGLTCEVIFDANLKL